MSMVVQTRALRRRPRPLTAHRWFPALVALWFAALFGLCALVVPPALLERLLHTLSIDRIIPPAAPPLGDTARLLIAASLSAGGAVSGRLLGRGLAALPSRPATPAQTSTQMREEPDLVELSRKPYPLAENDAAEQHIDKAVAPEPWPDEPGVAAMESRAARNISAAPLDTLGVVQLSERLALAMHACPEPRLLPPAEIAQRLEAARESLRSARGAR